MQFARRSGEAQFFSDGDKIAQVAEFHIQYISQTDQINILHMTVWVPTMEIMVSRKVEVAAAAESAVEIRHDDPPVWIVMMAGACAFLTLYATQPILPLLADVFQVKKAAVSLTIFASTMGVALAAPFMGLLADQLGRRKIIIWSALALGLTSVLAASSGNLPQLIFWRFVQGVFTPGVFVITVTYINEEWNTRKAGSAMAAYVSATVLRRLFRALHIRLCYGACGLADRVCRAGCRGFGNDRGHVALDASRTRIRTRASIGIAVRGRSATYPESRTAGSLRCGFLLAVHAGEHVQLCDLLSCRAAV